MSQCFDVLQVIIPFPWLIANFSAGVKQNFSSLWEMSAASVITWVILAAGIVSSWLLWATIAKGQDRTSLLKSIS